MKRRMFVMSGIAPVALTACGGGADDPQTVTDTAGSADRAQALRFGEPIAARDDMDRDPHRLGIMLEQVEQHETVDV